MKVPLSGPDITEREKQLVLEVLDSGQLSLGSKLEAFEAKMAAYVGRRYAIACNSGTSALHMLIRAMGIGEEDEVITTPFSFVSSSNCILYERARPVFVDIDEQSFNINPELIAKHITERTKAILPVHVFGQPANMEAIMDVAQTYGLRVIEDACEAIGAFWNGKMAGSFGDAGVFAFYPNKQMTTGEGGMIVTDDPELAALCRSLRNQGRGEDGLWLSHVRLGWNYRLDELSAALGIAQLERIEQLLGRRAEVAARYLEKLADVPGVILPVIDPRAEMSWFVFVIRLQNSLRRDFLMERLLAQGIGCRPYFPPIHLQPFYQQQFGYQQGDFQVTESVSASTLAIPFFSGLTEAQIDYVCRAIHQELAVCL
ncbi:DegT/DnrJ/EryC1/StrS family aminotransferase [Brevibacillus ruminantium]|uniref:DegT/DnrJ/EryC1/StrS family aminotransferase n=1 Tax=Brevibacillus ruminantium TaxID=2950604 RepID=A0ABY4WP30_9BACL|nr:DegT/DnrJ/EryC1/StrS family aminotransferase [Brevibacillus ruminantium]USG67144.1 DegT/DnrJ/EryC1/StrS family aminotransferase [Brevibacillus ruminantium]